jgi:transposase
MARKYKRYSEEFKRDAVAMSASSDVSDAQLERDLGITPGLLSKWRNRYRIEAESGELKPSEEREAEAEIRRLKRELAIAWEERDILKKAIQVFSKDRPL